ncbi:MAG: hypothetical protein RIT28_4677 [Pseudomonadota bacterium]
MRFMEPYPPECLAHFATNLGRVSSLVKGYTQRDLPAEMSPAQTDLLRATVVFLHASLEDLLRSLEERHIDHQVEAGDGLAGVPFAFDAARASKEKISLAELAEHHLHRPVREVVRISLARELASRSYNNLQEVDQAMRRVGLRLTLDAHQRQALNVMIARRHHIAHRADRASAPGLRHHSVLPLHLDDVNAWIDIVRAIGDAVDQQLTPRRNE